MNASSRGADGKAPPRDGYEPPPDDPEALGPPGDPESAARTICLRLLDRRARSRAELAQALSRRGIPDDTARRVLDRFAEVGLVDDAALAGGMALAQHRERGLAGRAVALKLRRRGLDEPDVQAAVAQIDPASERATAERLVERKLRSMHGLEPAVAARRLVGLLARKGYSSGVAYEVVRRVLAVDDVADGADVDVDVEVDQPRGAAPEGTTDNGQLGQLGRKVGRRS